ncbi:MAG: hypothetical protein ACFFFH_09005 [Candidatus Thorarchaeota archaeon]
MSSNFRVLTLIPNNMRELITFLPKAESHLHIDYGAIINEDD